MSKSRLCDPERIGESRYLRELRRKIDDPEWQAMYCSEPEQAPPEPKTRHNIPPSFISRCRKLGLGKYLDDLLLVMDGGLEENDLFRRFRAAWHAAGAKEQRAIVLGSAGAGKSVVSLWACLQEVRHQRGFDFIDLAKFSSLWAMQDHDRFHNMEHCGLLVIDEIGDCDDIRGPAFGQFKLLVNARYQRQVPTILCTTQDEEQLVKAIGHEIVDRFPIRIGTQDKRSYRGRTR